MGSAWSPDCEPSEPVGSWRVLEDHLWMRVALGEDRVHGVYVDTGFMRKHESADVMAYAARRVGGRPVRAIVAERWSERDRVSPGRAGTLLGAAQVVRERTGLYNAPSFSFHQQFVDGILAGPGADTFGAATERGRRLHVDDAVAYALGHEHAEAAASAT